MSVAAETRTVRKRRDITEAATEAFLRRGFDGTSMDDIAAAAGVSKQTMYKQFTSKEALFREMIGRIVSEAGDAVYAELTRIDLGEDLANGLRRLARRQLALVMNPRLLQLRRLVIAEAERFPWLGRAFYDQGPGRTISELATRFASAPIQAQLAINDPAIAAAHFNWLVMSIPVNQVMFLGSSQQPSREELDQIADAGVAAFLRAYERR